MGNFCTNCGRPLKEGFDNLLTALKTIWTDPTKAASTLASGKNWLQAIILIVAQALFTAVFSLTSIAFGIGIEDGSFLAITFFFTFFATIATNAAAMGMYLGIGKAVKGDVDLKSALATASIRCFVRIPFTFIALFLTMANIGIGIFLFFIGEIIGILLTFLAVQESYKISTNRTFIVVCATYLAIFIVFIIFAAIYVNVNADDFMKALLYSSLSSIW